MLRSKLSSLREYLTPINNSSNFTTTGEISPDEFVQAGDYLVLKFPTWSWASCPKHLQKSFLPVDKQVLITKHVPSYQRADTLIGSYDEEEEEEDGESGWVNPKSHVKKATAEEIEEIVVDDDTDEELGDFDDLEIVENSDTLRKYDLYITYSTSYRVPKLYLVGYNSNGIPLLPKQMFEDINSDYKDKTATIEPLPVGVNVTAVSIHPCNHSNVMRVLMKHTKTLTLSEPSESSVTESKTDPAESTEVPTIRADQYLIIFLKFIASVTPGIEYDYTMDAL